MIPAKHRENSSGYSIVYSLFFVLFLLYWNDHSAKRPIMTSTNYIDDFLPPSVVQRLEAGAFQSLCGHLRDRSDQVQNIDLMTVSGFCRNCLAKWLVVEARKLSDDLRSKAQSSGTDGIDADELDSILQSLDAMGYDEAAQYVYGMNYNDWKKRHAKNKVSDEVMQKFNDSKPLWASHDKQILTKRSEGPPNKKLGSSSSTTFKIESKDGAATSSLLSNVCCQDIDAPQTTKKSRRELPLYQPPTPPEVSFSMGILTVSDRASSGEYETGDLSGPAVKDAVELAVTMYEDKVKLQSTTVAIVPDDIDAIQSKLKEWADISNLQLILTTGGTGFSPRDVTPEATNLVVDSVCEGLVSFCTLECAKRQPLASLSRGSAGIRGNTLIVNLPGNPKGVQEIIPVLLPLALHVVADLGR